MWEGLQSVLPIIIGCGVGIVVCVTYIVCLLLFGRKHKGRRDSLGKVEVYELIDDNRTLVVPLNGDSEKHN